MVSFIPGSRRHFENKIKHKSYVLDDVDLTELPVDILLTLDLPITCSITVLTALYGHGYSSLAS